MFTPTNLAMNRQKRLLREYLPEVRHTTESALFSVTIKAEEASMSSTTRSTLPMTVAETVTTLPPKAGPRPKTGKKAAGDLGRIHKPRVAKHGWRTKGEAFDPAKVTRNPLIAAPIDLDEK